MAALAACEAALTREAASPMRPRHDKRPAPAGPDAGTLS
jgi:hypothetical protein